MVLMKGNVALFNKGTRDDFSTADIFNDSQSCCEQASMITPLMIHIKRTCYRWKLTAKWSSHCSASKIGKQLYREPTTGSEKSKKRWWHLRKVKKKALAEDMKKKKKREESSEAMKMEESLAMKRLEWESKGRGVLCPPFCLKTRWMNWNDINKCISRFWQHISKNSDKNISDSDENGLERESNGRRVLCCLLPLEKLTNTFQDFDKSISHSCTTQGVYL